MDIGQDEDVILILHRAAEVLCRVDGVLGVVLGGSRARGTHDDGSDIDIGIYYDKNLNLPELNAAASRIDDEHRENLLSPPGTWGKWVNGGVWLTMGGRPVDLLLRDLSRVRRAVLNCLSGRVTPHYQTGHPHAYLNAMYMGELAVCFVIHDADGRVQALKERTTPYPRRLKEAMLAHFGFEMGFSLMFAAASAGRDDMYYVAAHLARSVSCMNQVLFALNGEYCLNEKKAVRMIDGFSIRPDGYGHRVEAAFTALGANQAHACELCHELVDEVKGLAEML